MAGNNRTSRGICYPHTPLPSQRVTGSAMLSSQVGKTPADVSALQSGSAAHSKSIGEHDRQLRDLYTQVEALQSAVNRLNARQPDALSLTNNQIVTQTTVNNTTESSINIYKGNIPFGGVSQKLEQDSANLTWNSGDKILTVGHVADIGATLLKRTITRDISVKAGTTMITTGSVITVPSGVTVELEAGGEWYHV